MFSLAISFVLKFNDTTHLAKQPNDFSCVCLVEAVIAMEKTKSDDFISYPVLPVAPLTFS